MQWSDFFLAPYGLVRLGRKIGPCGELRKRLRQVEELASVDADKGQFGWRIVANAKHIPAQSCLSEAIGKPPDAGLSDVSV